MLKKKYGVDDPFRKRRNYIAKGERVRQLRGWNVVRCPGLTVAEFNQFMAGHPSAQKGSDGWIRVKCSGYDADEIFSVVRSLLSVYAFDLKKHKEYKNGCSIYFGLATRDDAEALELLKAIFGAGPIKWMVKLEADGNNTYKVTEIMTSSIYGVQSGGYCWKFDQKGVVSGDDEAVIDEAERTTGKDIDGDGYVGKGTDAKKVSGFSLTSNKGIIAVVAGVLVLLLIIKKKRKG